MEAMKNGYVERNFIKCLIIGAAGVGKTAIKHRLLNKDPPEVRKSTPLMENPVRAITFSRAVEIGDKKDDMWSIINNDKDLMEIIAGHLQTLQEETKRNIERTPTDIQSSLSTLKLKDARNDSALYEPSQGQNNPASDHNLKSTEKPFQGEYTSKQIESEMPYLNIPLLSQKNSIKPDNAEVEMTDSDSTTPTLSNDSGITDKFLHPLKQPVLNKEERFTENPNPSHSHDKESIDDSIQQKFIEYISEARGMYFTAVTTYVYMVINTGL